MYKQELIRKVADNCNFTYSAVEQMLNEMCSVISKEVKKGNRVQITRFGTFDSSTWRKHRITSIADGSEITIPKRKVARFKAGSDLKKSITK